MFRQDASACLSAFSRSALFEGQETASASYLRKNNKEKLWRVSGQAGTDRRGQPGINSSSKKEEEEKRERRYPPPPPPPSPPLSLYLGQFFLLRWLWANLFPLFLDKLFLPPLRFPRTYSIRRERERSEKKGKGFLLFLWTPEWDISDLLPLSPPSPFDKSLSVSVRGRRRIESPETSRPQNF